MKVTSYRTFSLKLGGPLPYKKGTGIVAKICQPVFLYVWAKEVAEFRPSLFD